MNRNVARLATALATVMVVSLGMTVSFAATAQASGPTRTMDYRAVPSNTYESKVLAQINKRRARHNLPAVRHNACADRFAERWSAHLAAKSIFKHQRMRPLLRKCDANYAAETIAKGKVFPRKLVSLWMNSRAHRAIILSRNPRYVGVAAVLDSRGVWVVTADFIRR